MDYSVWCISEESIACW